MEPEVLPGFRLQSDIIVPPLYCLEQCELSLATRGSQSSRIYSSFMFVQFVFRIIIFHLCFVKRNIGPFSWASLKNGTEEEHFNE